MLWRAATISTDTEFLKAQEVPGPFTSVMEIDKSMDSYPNSKGKNQRMYREIRFQRMTPTRQKETDAIFRLKKSGEMKKPWYWWLCKQFKSIYWKDKKITIEDLGSVLNISHHSDKENTEEESGPVTDYSVGEHVAILWQDDDGDRWVAIGGILVWWLSSVKLAKEMVSYYKRGNKNATSWNYPDETEIRKTNVAQVLSKQLTVSVSYHCVMQSSDVASPQRKPRILMNRWLSQQNIYKINGNNLTYKYDLRSSLLSFLSICHVVIYLYLKCTQNNPYGGSNWYIDLFSTSLQMTFKDCLVLNHFQKRGFFKKCQLLCFSSKLIHLVPT